MTEAEEVTLATKEIRTKEDNLGRRHQFDLKFTYWDADDLALQMRLGGQKQMILNRNGADIVVTCDPNYKHKTKFTVRPDQLIELFVMGKDSVEKVILTQQVFSDLGH